jgi:hypothetical protein
VSNRKEHSKESPVKEPKKFGEGDYGSEEDMEGGSILEKGAFKTSTGFALASDPWAEFITKTY